MSEKETKMQSFRLSTSSVEKFRAYCEENKICQADGFDALLNNAELEKAKNAIPDRKAEIENVQNHANALVSAFIYSLDIYTSAKDSAKADVADKLSKKDLRIEALEEEKAVIKATLCEKDKRVSELEKILAERDNQIGALTEAHQNALKSLKDKDRIIASIEGENARFEALTNDYEHLQKTYTELAQKVMDYEKQISELVQQAKNSERFLLETKRKHDDIISQLKVQHQNALEAADNRMEKAVLATQAEWQKRHDESVSRYEIKLDELEKRNNEVATLKEKNHKLEQELSLYKKWDDANDNGDDSDFDVWEV